MRSDIDYLEPKVDVIVGPVKDIDLLGRQFKLKTDGRIAAPSASFRRQLNLINFLRRRQLKLAG